jgi:O-methyltransferase
LNNKDFLQNKLFLEFGVHKGESLLEFYKLYKNYDINRNFFGFDSFVGLPEEKNDLNSPWKTGKFSCNGNINPDLLNKIDINIIDGWFNQTLNDSLVAKFNHKKIGILHMDCDIYTSTVDVWEFVLKHDLLCDGSIIIYDDWGSYLMNNKREYENGQSKAHRDIQQKYNLNIQLINKIALDPSFYIISTFRYIRR